MAIAIGVSSKGRTGSAASIATTGVTTQASGSVIVAGMIFQNTFSSVTDSKSNSPYQQISVERVFSGATGKARMYFFPNATGGASHAVTGTVSGGVTAITVLMAEITGSSGIDTGATSVIDAASPFSTSITPTAGNRLVLAFLAGDSASNPATHAEANGFTILTSAEETNGASFWEGVLAYKIVAADGVTAVTVSFTDSGAANCAVYLAAFIESSTGVGARLSSPRTRTGPYMFRKPTLAYSISAASTDVTLALTGVVGTGAVGTLAPSTTAPITGNVGTGAVGTASPSVSLALTGNAATGSAGTLTPSTTVALSGVQGTSAVGSVATSGDITLALTGVSGTGATGSLAPSTTLAVTGVTGTASPGNIGPASSTALTGNAATGSVGTLAPATTIALTGALATGFVGNVGVQGDVTIALTGVEGTAQVGNVAASTITADAGVSGGFFADFDRYAQRRRKHKDEQAQVEAETQAIESPLDRSIAELLREQERKDERRAEMQRLQALADRYAGQGMKAGLSRAASAALLKAYEERSRNALEQLNREVERMLEEEEVAIVAALMLDE